MRAPRLSSGLRALLIALFLAPALAACGEAPSKVDAAKVGALAEELQKQWRAADRKRLKALLDEIDRLGKQHPQTVVPELIARLKRERTNPDSSTVVVRLDYSKEEGDVAQLKARADADFDVLLRRAQTHFRPDQMRASWTSVDAEGMAKLELTLFGQPAENPDEDPRLRLLRDVVSRPGSIELVPIVDRPEADAAVESLWAGDADAYDAFLARHLPALQKAMDEGRRTTTGDGETRLVVMRPPAPGKPRGTAMILRSASRSERFTQDDMELSGKLNPGTGAILLNVELDEPSRDRFDAWCITHRGRRAALLVDDILELEFPVPPSSAKLRFIVLGTIAPKRPANFDELPEADRKKQQALEGAAEQARGLLAYILRATRPGSIEVPIEVTVRDEVPKRMDTPLAIALVRVGPGADSYLAQVQAEGGLLGRRARWIRDEIRKLESEKEAGG